MDYSIAGLLDSTDIVDLNNPDSEIEPAIAELEKVLAAMSQETGVEIIKALQINIRMPEFPEKLHCKTLKTSWV